MQWPMSRFSQSDRLSNQNDAKTIGDETMPTLSRPRPNRAEFDQSDGALVDQARLDSRRFEALFDRYWEPVLRFCLVRLNDWQLAEDAASQAFINAHRNLHMFQGVDESSFRCWLFAIARNTVRDAHRATYRHPTFPLSEAEEVVDPTESPEDAALDAERNRMLQQILHELPEDQRQLIELRAAGLTAAEIGAVLGKSEAAVRQAQSRLIRSLRAQFAGTPDGELRHV